MNNGPGNLYHQRGSPGVVTRACRALHSNMKKNASSWGSQPYLASRRTTDVAQIHVAPLENFQSSYGGRLGLFGLNFAPVWGPLGKFYKQATWIRATSVDRRRAGKVVTIRHHLVGHQVERRTCFPRVYLFVGGPGKSVSSMWL